MPPDESRIDDLLERALVDGLTPEEVCADDLELLPQVRRYWEACQTVSSELDELFPSKAETGDARDDADAAMPDIPGYDVFEVLGRGGMGVVYRGRHRKLNRPIALKMMLAGMYGGSLELKRFEREAQIIASLCHPQIVQVFDVGDVDGRPFYTMELIEAGSLARQLEGKPLPVREATELIRKLAVAMDLVHRNGIIHRDLKPGNILIAADCTPKISDFGLAFQWEGNIDLTMTGGRAGTPSYMAPEQILGQKSSIGPAADIYSLGAVLYELLAGRPPFQADSVLELQRRVVSDEPIPPTRINRLIPRDLQSICLKCLEKEPQRRYRSTGELAEDLDRFWNGLPVHARPVQRWEVIRRWMNRNRSTSAALAGVALLLVLIAAGSWWSAAHFRALADEKSRLAQNLGAERDRALSAEQHADELRGAATSVANRSRRELYFAEMTLAGQAAAIPGGLVRVREHLSHWNTDVSDLRNWEWYYLNALCHRDLQHFQLHLNGALDVVWSPDGRTLATAGADGTICLFDPQQSAAPHRLKGHHREISAIAWNRSGTRLASASWDGTVRLWDTVTREQQLSMNVNSELFCVAWSPDQSLVAASGKDQVIRFWDSATGELHGELVGHSAPVAGLEWHPDGMRLASGDRDAIVMIWDLPNRSLVQSLRGHRNWVHRVAWSPDGNRLASASNDQEVRIWNPTDGTTSGVLNGHTQGVTAVAWSPNGEQLVTASDDRSIKLWSAANGRELATLNGHSSGLTAVAWNPDSDELASSSFDGSVKLWNVASTPDVSLPLPSHGPIESLAWNPVHSQCLAIGTADGTVQLWDQEQSRVQTEFQASPRSVRSMAWNATGTLLAVAGADTSLTIWDPLQTAAPGLKVPLQAATFALSWSPDDSVLAIATDDSIVSLVTPLTGASQQILSGLLEPVVSLKWHPDGQTLVAGSRDGSVKFWDKNKARVERQLPDQRSAVVSLALHPHQEVLALASARQDVTIWNSSTGEFLQSLRGHAIHPDEIAWSPDGSRLASAGRDGRLKVWDADSGREVLTLGRGNESLTTLAWNRNGTLLAAGSEGQTVQIYDARAGYIQADVPWNYSRFHAHRAEPPGDIIHTKKHTSAGNRNLAEINYRDVLKETSRPFMILDGFFTGVRPSSKGLNEQADSARISTVFEAAESDAVVRPDWPRMEDSHQGVVDLGKWCDRREHVAATVLFPIFSAEQQPARIWFGSDDGARIWLNRKLVWESTASGTAVPDQTSIPATLKSGWNWLLVEVTNQTGDHGFYLRLAEPTSLEVPW